VSADRVRFKVACPSASFSNIAVDLQTQIFVI
jgi:hypothetical protein